MTDRKYIFYINKTHFETIYDIDHYNDKRVFFSNGAKQFFSVYQVLKDSKFKLVIQNSVTDEKFIVKDTGMFAAWVKENYPQFEKYLDDPSWPEIK